jgi:hypothetical protein
MSRRNKSENGNHQAEAAVYVGEQSVPPLYAVFGQCLFAILILGGVAAPVIAANTSHKQPPPKPVAVKTAAIKKPASKPSKPTPAPQPAPAPVVAASPPPAPKPKPKPFPSNLPAPGSGPKALAPVNPAAPPSGTSSGSDPPATGGYASLNWAGYVAINGGYTSVSGSWKVPNPTGNGSTMTADSSWIGIGGAFSSDLIQTGTMNFVSSSGQVTSAAFYELLPDAALEIAAMNISPGDLMFATIIETSAANWQISLTDNTTGQNFSANVSYSSSHSSAEWIEEDPSFLNGSLVPFDNFGKSLFSSSLANNASISANAGKPITLVNNSFQALAFPSILTGGGTAFSVTHN